MQTNVNRERCILIGKFLKNAYGNSLDNFYKFDDPAENPGLSLDLELVANFYGAVINLDHHFFTLDENGRFKADYGMIDGKLVKGSSYLWKKSKQMLDANPRFFSAENLSTLSEKAYKEWLSDESGKIPIWDKGMHRLHLTRDFGTRLELFYGGSFLNLIDSSGYYLVDSGSGFLERCEVFEGYRDAPLYKKANLFAKVWERRGLGKFKDAGHKIPPEDYHLQNVSWRSGMIEIPKEILDKALNGEFLNLDEELAVRLACKDAHAIVSEVSGIEAYYLDDIIWQEGRGHCQKETPSCSDSQLAGVCVANTLKSGLKDVPFFYVDTWRY